MDQNQELISEKERAVAYAELQLAGHIEYSEDGENFKLTTTGLDAAFKLWYSLPAKDRVYLFLLGGLIIDAGEYFGLTKGGKKSHE